MAETLGLIASVIQAAGAGLELSQTLDQYVDGVATADGMIKNIAKEIRLTSFMIEELGDVFKHDNTSILMSKNAVKAAEETMKECSSVFTEISTVSFSEDHRSQVQQIPMGTISRCSRRVQLCFR
jgi:predicted site-specific integrase-resolvase